MVRPRLAMDTAAWLASALERTWPKENSWPLSVVGAAERFAESLEAGEQVDDAEARAMLVIPEVWNTTLKAIRALVTERGKDQRHIMAFIDGCPPDVKLAVLAIWMAVVKHAAN